MVNYIVHSGRQQSQAPTCQLISAKLSLGDSLAYILQYKSHLEDTNEKL